ncbi:MAG: hypothetical protein ACKO5K_16035, partial [Armatimonadota bacterium]
MIESILVVVGLFVIWAIAVGWSGLPAFLILATIVVIVLVVYNRNQAHLTRIADSERQSNRIAREMEERNQTESRLRSESNRVVRLLESGQLRIAKRS